MSGKACIVLIEDSWGYVFGGFLSQGIEDRQSYYGNSMYLYISILYSMYLYIAILYSICICVSVTLR
jgi:hypothetical protein